MARGQEQEPLLAAQGQAQQPQSYADNEAIPFFNSGPRQWRDKPWLWGFLAFNTLLLAGGIALAYTGSPDFATQVSVEHLSDPNSCPVGGQRRLLLQDADGSDDTNYTLTALLAHPVGSLVGSVLGSLTLGFLFLLGFRHRAHHMVNLAISLQIAIPLAAALAFLFNGVFIGAAVMALLAGLYIWLFLTWREQIVLVTRLLGISGAGLVANPGLIGISLALPLVWTILLIPAGVFGFFAVTNGSVVPNSSRVGPPTTGDDGHLMCSDVDGNPILCCAWQMDGVAMAYLGLLGVGVTWSSMLMSAIKMFTVAGATVQWYFSASPGAPSTSAAGSGPVKQRRRRGRVATSLGHALGPSLGSLIAAAALLTVVQYLRQALDECEKRVADSSVNGFVRLILAVLSFFLRLFLALVEFLTRFTVVRMAMTGDSFIESAHGAVDLLKRNALDAFGVWWLPPFVLQNCAFMVSLAYGTLVWGTSSLVWGPAATDASSITLGVIAGFLALLVLSFFCGLLLNIMDAVFVCFAVDRDNARITRTDVYDVVKDLPGVGQVVQQPDGGIAYGAPPAASRV